MNAPLNDTETDHRPGLTLADTIVKNRLLYHGRLGGNLPHLQDSPMYFYAEGSLSSVFSEHAFLNGNDTSEIASAANSEHEFNQAYLTHAPVVFLMRVNIDNPIILDTKRLHLVAQALGIAENKRETFIADFEDSVDHIRTQVLNWARQQGHDGAIIENDWTPEVAGGDSYYQTSYVAFEPHKQVRFAFDNPTNKPTTSEPPRRSSPRPRM